MTDINTADERVFLTAEQAIAMLPEGERVHTFRNPAGGMMLGADWPRDKIEQAIRQTEHRELTGKVATSMGHGLVIDNDGPLFIATKREGL